MSDLLQCVLLLGGSGQLGSEIGRLWNDVEIIAPPGSEVNVENAEAVRRAIEQYRPSLVINCTAFHNVDRCETEPDRAFEVNALAVEQLAQCCRESDCGFVTFSTDYVFDGELGRAYSESDRPNPVSAYGVSKYAGELLVQRLRSKAFIVRTCGLYGMRVSSSKGYTFIDKLINNARAGQALRVVNDMTVSPSYAGHVALALRELIQTERYGLYHMANAGATTWYDYATQALRAAGLSNAIEPISYKSWESTVRRPPYSALENAKLGVIGITLPPWQSGIADYFRDKPEAAPTAEPKRGNARL